jgi:RHS repeat-associated protein
MGASGQLVARNVPTDAYGNDRLELDGPAVDGITIEATGEGVDITLHAIEQLTESTVATGMRLVALDSNGGVVRMATAAAALVPGDPYAARITLTSLEWKALTDPSATSGLAAQSLSVAATSTLRARGWSAEVPFLPAPDWARASLPIFATAALPVEARESLASLATWLATNPTGSDATRSLYQVDTLALLAQPSTGAATPITTLLTARFQAQPFADPFTGKNYVRERWYDPERGSWLSPDPMGNRDSANLYAFGSGDPVNGRDPTGSQSRPDFTPDERRQMQKQYAREIASLRESCERDELSDACIGMLGTILGDVSPAKFKAGERYSGDSTLLINGVLNDAREATAGGESAAEMLRSPMVVLWNPTMESIPSQNLAAKLLRLAFDGAQLFAVNDLGVKDRTSLFVARELRLRIRALRPGRTLRVAAHSAGVGVVAAASSYLTAAEVARIDFVAIGEGLPASIFTQGMHSVERYINVLDPVAMVLGGGIFSSALDSIFHGHTVHYRAFVYTDGGWIHTIGAYAAEERAQREADQMPQVKDWVTVYNQTMAKAYGH